jgi:inner membrane protein
MDSLTQIILGAAVGELVAGRKLGYKAALWGGIAATIPDLDVLFGLFLDPVDYLAIHRGFTHSIFFSAIAAPLLALGVHRFHKGAEATFKDWLRLFYFALLTHPILDLFTGYGTQFLYPITNYAFEFNAIFIIDPLYTLPLLFCLLVALTLARTSNSRRIWGITGLSVTTFYLLLTVGFKWMAMPVFKAELDRQSIEYSRMMTIPGPFNSVLWRALVETEDGYWQGHYSLLDRPGREITFYFTPRNEHKISSIMESKALKRLLWFSKGFYHVTDVDGNLHFNDLRFGSYNSWNGDMQNYVFSFQIKHDSDFPDMVSFAQVQMPVDIKWEDFESLWARTLGYETYKSDQVVLVEENLPPESSVRLTGYSY